MKIDFTPLIELLQSSEHIVITTHINPDGDAIGSALALNEIVRYFGKKASLIVNQSRCPSNFQFLSNSKDIKMYNAIMHNQVISSADVIIVTDLCDLSRVKSMEEPIIQSPAIKVIVDHHPGTPAPCAKFVFSDFSSAATGELVYYLLKQADVPLTKDIAEMLYVSIYTDTAGFSVGNVTSELYHIVADLVEAGASPEYLYNQIYRCNSVNKVKLQGIVKYQVRLYLDNKVAVYIATDSMFTKTQTTDIDLQGLAEQMLDIEGCDVALLVSEHPDKSEVKFSMRSKGSANVNKVAEMFGGGGHKNAAGCRLHDIDLLDAINRVLKEIEKIIVK